MGLGNNEGEELDADDEEVLGGIKDEGSDKSFEVSSVFCSICLEIVADNGDRSWAKLYCGHQFHLDCIGSAFNAKGVMQCPNCRKIEKGQWLYANGHRSIPDLNIEDWGHEEDLYDLSYTEMSFGVHWCPYNSLARLRPPFQEGEYPSNTYPEIIGQHSVYPEHSSAVSSASHPCPYVTYFGPIYHPSSSTSTGSFSDGAPFSSHWNAPMVTGEVADAYPFHTMDLRYQNWDPASQRSARSNPDVQRSASFMHPFVAQSASSSVASSISPPYQGSNARTRDRVQALQAYYQQQPGSSPPGTRRGNPQSHRNALPLNGSVASSSDQNNLYFVPARSFLEAENPPIQARYRAWDADHTYPGERETSRQMVFHAAAGNQEAGAARSRQRQAPERVRPLQNR